MTSREGRTGYPRTFCPEGGLSKGERRIRTTGVLRDSHPQGAHTHLKISLPFGQRKQKPSVGPQLLSWERGRFATRHCLKGDTWVSQGSPGARHTAHAYGWQGKVLRHASTGTGQHPSLHPLLSFLARNLCSLFPSSLPCAPPSSGSHCPTVTARVDPAACRGRKPLDQAEAGQNLEPKLLNAQVRATFLQ